MELEDPANLEFRQAQIILHVVRQVDVACGHQRQLALTVIQHDGGRRVGHRLQLQRFAHDESIRVGYFQSPADSLVGMDCRLELPCRVSCQVIFAVSGSKADPLKFLGAFNNNLDRRTDQEPPLSVIDRVGSQASVVRRLGEQGNRDLGIAQKLNLVRLRKSAAQFDTVFSRVFQDNRRTGECRSVLCQFNHVHILVAVRKVNATTTWHDTASLTGKRDPFTLQHRMITGRHFQNARCRSLQSEDSPQK